jgi:tRNA U34 5-carboxymethylaminomethyl modifying enzyme MnmG/GidA
VEDLSVSEDVAGKRVDGVVMKNGRKIRARSVVITTGTFLRGQACF